MSEYKINHIGRNFSAVRQHDSWVLAEGSYFGGVFNGFNDGTPEGLLAFNALHKEAQKIFDISPSVESMASWQPDLANASGPASPAPIPDALRRLSERATQGEWAGICRVGTPLAHVVSGTKPVADIYGGRDTTQEERFANSHLIAAAVNYVRSLIGTP